MTVLWILLWIIAIIIGVPLVIFLVLAVTPVRYRVTAAVGGETFAKVSVSYLLHLFHLTFTYDAEKKTDVAVYIAGFELNRKPAEEKQKPEKIKKVKKIKKNRRKNIMEETAPPEKKGLKETFAEIKAVLTRKDLKIIIGLFFEYIKRILIYLLPKRFKVTGVVGLSDPFQTGLFIGACDAVTGALKKTQTLRLAGDFNEKTVHLNIYAKGRVSAAGLMIPTVWLISRGPVFNFLIEYINKARKKNKEEKNKRDEG